MRRGTGRVYLLAITAFAVGVLMASGPVRAQNQDPPSKLYLTPGAESTAHPLFLQRLFGSSGSSSGLGQGKPYDFSTQRIIRHETQDWREMADKFNEENKAKFDAVIDERKKAIAQMYAESDVELRADEQRRRQAEAQVQAQIQEIARKVRVPVVYGSGPPQNHTSRGTRPVKSGNNTSRTNPPPVYYNAQPQNAHPPIFLH